MNTLPRTLAICTLALVPACALFAPTHENLMAHCVADPQVKKLATRAGVPVEAFCDKLITEAERDEQATGSDAGDAGAGLCTERGCPVR